VIAVGKLVIVFGELEHQLRGLVVPEKKVS